jgi:hypothetical protein
MPDPNDPQNLTADLESLTAELAKAREMIASLERRQRIDALLAESDAVDLDVARLLTEAAVQQMSEPDVKLAIDDLRKHKPYLFRRRHSGTGTPSAAAMGARTVTSSPVAEAAETAAQTGNRRDLLRYLRLRRSS